jgi:hypothetical protein
MISQADACHGKSISSEIQTTPPDKSWEIVAKFFDDGWPAYEEPFVAMQTL